MELNLAWEIKDNTKGKPIITGGTSQFHYVNSKRKTIENVGTLLHEVSALVMEDT